MYSTIRLRPTVVSLHAAQRGMFGLAQPVGWAENDALAVARATFRVGKTGRQKAGPVPKDRPLQVLWLSGAYLQCLRCRFRLDLCSRSRFLLCCELMLNLEGNRIGIHLVRLGCGAENLTSVRLLAG